MFIAKVSLICATVAADPGATSICVQLGALTAHSRRRFSWNVKNAMDSLYMPPFID